MWICLSDAFLSIVAAKEKGHLMVRARNAEHLKKLFPRNKIVVTPDNDYRYRVVVRPEKVAKLIAARLATVDYVKFKPTVTERKLHDLYLDFWFLHEQYQQDLLAHDELDEVGPVGDGEREELANDRWASTQYAD